MDAAARARAGGYAHEALSNLERVLAVEPENTDLHRQVAPLLAAVGRQADAWRSYAHAGHALSRQGYYERAEALYRDALARVPDEAGPWLAAADLARTRGQIARAIEILREARRQFEGRRFRRQAIEIVRALAQLEPQRHDHKLLLARLCASEGRHDESRGVLSSIAQSARGPVLAEARWIELRYRPTPRAFVRWVKARG